MNRRQLLASTGAGAIVTGRSLRLSAQEGTPAATDGTHHLPSEGAALHTFNLDAKHNPADSAIHSGDVPPGAAATVTLTLPAGAWSVSCSLPGHESAGMFGTVRAE